MSLKEKIDQSNLPRHIAIIMDGNGRWAKKQGALRLFGHNNAIKSVRDITEACAEIGIQYLTLYAFSTENWNRPEDEIKGLMELLVATISSEVKTLNKNSIKLNAIGNIQDLPEKCQKALNKAIDDTKNNTRLTLNLALSYSGRSEIIQGVRSLIREVKEGRLIESDIDENIFGRFLYTSNVPDPELLIRTSGEYRISNFLLWQVAYAELYFTEVLWPDFRKEDLFKAILDYQKRERRFGKISEQLNN